MSAPVQSADVTKVSTPVYGPQVPTSLTDHRVTDVLENAICTLAHVGWATMRRVVPADEVELRETLRSWATASGVHIRTGSHHTEDEVVVWACLLEE